MQNRSVIGELAAPVVDKAAAAFYLSDAATSPIPRADVMTPSKDIARLIEIMAALRDPQSGCPWDIEQDFASIAPYTIEEAYEVADAIQRGDRDDLRDELGDLLLQVVYHARMAEEEGAFDFGDVVHAVTKKMIRRHPHVFGDEAARGAGMAKGMWERIKAEEKAEKRAARLARGLDPEDHGKGFLDGIPLVHPALTRALKLQEKAARVGFDWKEAKPILDKIEEEIGELREAMEKGADDEVAGEFGDVLFAIVNFGRHLKLDAEDALRRTNDKFRNRFHYVEAALEAQGRTLDDASLDDMEALWQQAKAAE
jgi:ATP diphosphatase